MSICPKNKSSKGRRDRRRANWKMTAPTLVKCSKCGALMVPHFLHTLWGTIKAPHLLHFTNVGAVIFQFALLLSLLPLEDLFLGQIDIVTPPYSR